jgi:hypothetical protein
VSGREVGRERGEREEREERRPLNTILPKGYLSFFLSFVL